MKNYKAAKFLSGRGYYLLLVLCVAAAGVFTYAAVRNSVKNSAPDEGSPYEYENTVPEEELSQPEETTETEDNSSTVQGQTASQGGSATQDNAEKKTDAAPADNAASEENVQQASNPVKAAKSQYMMPVSGDIIKSFSEDKLVFSMTMNDYRVHNGIDISAAAGTSVNVVADGTIEQVYSDDMMGTTVVVTHADGKQSIYANLNATLKEGIAPGTAVKAGDVIGTVGNTALEEVSEAPHLHFAVLSKGEFVNPEKLLK